MTTNCRCVAVIDGLGYLHDHLLGEYVAQLKETDMTSANGEFSIADIKRAAMKISYGRFKTTRYAHRVPALECLEWLVAEREKEQRKFVQVRFEKNGRLYTYRCKKADVGDYVIVPPPRPGAFFGERQPRVLKVVAKGRGSWTGSVRTAHKVPQAIVDSWSEGELGPVFLRGGIVVGS